MCDIEKCSLYIENQVEEITAYSHTRHVECVLLGISKHFKIYYILSVD